MLILVVLLAETCRLQTLQKREPIARLQTRDTQSRLYQGKSHIFTQGNEAHSGYRTRQ